MILRPRWSPPILLLAATLLISEVLADTSNLNGLRRLGDATLMANAAADALSKTGPIGTKDAPVDGRDGMPHEGPFVETIAERNRKKIMETGDEEPAPPVLKMTVDKDMPVSNDGVMDDARRLGPAEGTRGTEGGVSGKSSSKLTDKKPDPPKESPPLPHSETEKMKDELRDILDGSEDRKMLAVSAVPNMLRYFLTFAETL
jgi:Ca2+/H+ antiporter, TMEM165/GDT1 family